MPRVALANSVAMMNLFQAEDIERSRPGWPTDADTHLRQPGMPRARSAEAAVYVVRGTRVDRGLEHPLGRARFHDVAGGSLSGEEERAVLGHPLRLLHIVRDDHDR